MREKLLEVNQLVTEFKTERGSFRVVDRISFDIERSQIVGLVGESGSGKSITSLSILGLIKPPGRITDGSIRLNGEELIGKPAKELRRIRGKKIAMIFQEPMTSLNPVLSIGDQITETIRLHDGISRKNAVQRAIDMLKTVGIPMPETRLKQYPHQLSGGMRQRVMIVMSLCCNPELLIADEPTTALDVTIQAQILDLLKMLNRKKAMGVLLVTHDLGVVSETCERVIVMYAGQIVEQGAVGDIFTTPLHPYTEALLKSIPTIGGSRDRLYSIPGSVPQLHEMPRGCRFQPRCLYADNRCVEQAPILTDVGNGRSVSCLNYGQLAQQGSVITSGEEEARA